MNGKSKHWKLVTSFVIGLSGHKLSTEVLVASEFISAGLALFLFWAFFKAYRLKQSVFLMGVPVGFLLLSFSYFLLGMFFLYENNVSFSQLFMWLRLVTQSYGFAFVAFSYYFSSRAERAGFISNFFALISILSGVTILSIFLALVATPLPIKLLSYDTVQVYFSIANLIFLGYIVLNLVKRLQFSHETTQGSSWVPAAFFLFWLGKFSLLIWAIEGSQTAFVFSHVCRFVALTLFIYIYFSSRRV